MVVVVVGCFVGGGLYLRGFDLWFVVVGLFCGDVFLVVVPCFVVWVCLFDFFFFFFSCCELVVIIVVADGKVVVVGAMDVFLGSGIYYFIVVVILFYCVES